MGRWLHENDYDALVKAMSDSFGGRVRPELIKAIIAAESAFNEKATRGEPQLGDASIGLMQVLYSTAKRLGFPGTITELYRPDANLYNGTKYLDELLKQTGGNVDAAISAYNGGYRPELGFGAVRTTTTPAVCLQWKPNARPKGQRTLAQDCAKLGTTTVGKFSNQQYVDRAKNYLDYFFEWQPPGPAAPSSPSGEATESTPPS